MSEETPKITTVQKEKDSKRVETGKRLAQLNKERKLHKEQQEDINENKSNINYSLILNVIGVTVAVASLYYARKKSNNEKKEVKIIEVPRDKPKKFLDTLE